MPIAWDQITPKRLAAGTSDLGSPANPIAWTSAGLIFLLLGIDAYGTTQPNNGTFQVFLELPGNGSIVLYQVQQSANFPGPFFWRGLIPLYPNEQELQVSSTVGFEFSLWGAIVPDFTVDQPL